jgi:hypothetical protein
MPRSKQNSVSYFCPISILSAVFRAMHLRLRHDSSAQSLRVLPLDQEIRISVVMIER